MKFTSRHIYNLKPGRYTVVLAAAPREAQEDPTRFVFRCIAENVQVCHKDETKPPSETISMPKVDLPKTNAKPTIQKGQLKSGGLDMNHGISNRAAVSLHLQILENSYNYFSELLKIEQSRLPFIVY